MIVADLQRLCCEILLVPSDDPLGSLSRMQCVCGEIFLVRFHWMVSWDLCLPCDAYAANPPGSMGRSAGLFVPHTVPMLQILLVPSGFALSATLTCLRYASRCGA